MACEKYRESIKKLALGNLHPKRELEMLAHAEECNACRESYAHASEVREAVDRSIEALVAGEPSPHFAARLRARIAAGPVPARVPWMKWTPVAAATLVLAALLVALLLRTPRHSGALEVSVLPSVAPMAPSNSPEANHSPPAAQIAPPRHNHALGATASARLASHEPEVPTVLVPPGQLAAAFELSDSLSSRRADGQQLIAAANKAGEPLKINDLVVPPLDKPAPLADSDDDSGSF